MGLAKIESVNGYKTTSPRRTGYRGAFAAICLCVTAPVAWPLSASAALVYTASGSGMSGSFAGITFSDADWSVTASGEADDVQTGTITVSPSDSIPITYSAVVPTVSIADSSNQWSAQLLNDDTNGLSWSVVAFAAVIDNAALSLNGFYFADASFSAGSGIGVITSPPELSDLVTPVVIDGTTTYESVTVATSAGALIIDTQANPAATRFEVAAAPAPGTLALFGLGGLLGWLGRRRILASPGLGVAHAEPSAN
jgi:hypothetical protein